MHLLLGGLGSVTDALVDTDGGMLFAISLFQFSITGRISEHDSGIIGGKGLGFLSPFCRASLGGSLMDDLFASATGTGRDLPF